MDAVRDSPAVNSALWAAYADALGWISELTDAAGLRRRLGGERLDDLVPWERKIGGRGGVTFPLPRGCYSDDTQLRLAVGRCCSADGFDVEAFSRVELPVWPAYALGGGNGTKSAASGMSKPNARWSANFVDGYVHGGGNGAAMRVQPHAWAPPRPTEALLRDVVRDSVVTHGHPRGILGACLHALTLADLMPGGAKSLAALGAKSWRDFAAQLSDVDSVIRDDEELSAFWLPAWRDAAGIDWEDALKMTLAELSQDVSAARECVESSNEPVTGYRAVVQALDLRSDSHRGSGTRTVIAALAVVSLWRRFDMDPHAAIGLVVNELGTDTDSIASMTGAYVGLLHQRRPKSAPLDWALIAREADRIERGQGSSFRYPDLLTFEPPKTQGDALVTSDVGLLVVGLGPVLERSKVRWNARGDFGWVAVETEFNQTLIIKRRRDLPVWTGQVATTAMESARPPAGPRPRHGDVGEARSGQVPEEGDGLFPVPSGSDPATSQILTASMEVVRNRKFASEVIGDTMKALNREYGAEVASAFGALVVAELPKFQRR